MPSRCITAIVELSGSGKSNVAGLAERLYDPEHGHHLCLVEHDPVCCSMVSSMATWLTGWSFYLVQSTVACNRVQRRRG